MTLQSRRTPTCQIVDGLDEETRTSTGGEMLAAACAQEQSNAMRQAMLREAQDADTEDVTLFMGLNTTVHDKTEIPESMAVLKEAEKRGYGKRSLLPVSDPFSNGEDTQKYSLGEKNAKELKTWHEDEDLKEGEVRFGDGEPLMLGTENLTDDDIEGINAVRDNWDTSLAKLGIGDAERAEICDALFGTVDDPKRLASGDGATNELLQYVMAMHRSNQGEIDIKTIVLSGHHWASHQPHDMGEDQNRGGGIWGENPDLERPGNSHGYDYRNDAGDRLGGDFFAFDDMRNLGEAFPEAYDKVESVHFSACNTHDLGMKDEDGNTQSTRAFLEDMYPNIERSSFWTGKAPGAGGDIGPNAIGETLLDDMAAAAGDEEAWHDAVFNKNRKKSNMAIRNEYNPESGKIEYVNDMEEVGNGQGKPSPISRKGAEYVVRDKGKDNRERNRDGFRKKDRRFSKRKDLKDWLFQAEDLPSQEAAPDVSRLDGKAGDVLP